MGGLLAIAAGADSARVPPAIGGLLSLVGLPFILFVFVGVWKAFAKAGEPGWAAWVPVYNIYVVCRIAGRPARWMLLLLVPIVNAVIALTLGIDVARRFGKNAGFGIGLVVLPAIFWPILGFGRATFDEPPPGPLVYA
ncbi:MAG: DUF5684 domain-containing protein [Planctomycetota bacterium]